MKRHLTEEELIEHQFKLASDEQAGDSAEHLASCAECRERLEQLNQKFAALDLLREDMPASEELISQTVAQAKQPAPRKIVPFGKYHWLGTAAAALVVGLALLIGNLGEQEARRPEFAEEPESEGAAYYDRSASPSKAGKEEQVRIVAKKLGDERGVQSEEALANKLAMKSVAAPSPASPDSPADKFSGDPTSRPDASTSPRHYAFAPPGQGPVPEKMDEAAMLSAARAPTTDPTQRTAVTWAETPEDVKIVAGTALGESVVAKISEKPPFAPASAIELVTLPRRDNVQLTIYNSADLTLVREKRNLTLKQGWNWLQLMWANTLIDPTSLSLEPAAQADKVDVQQLVFPARLRELGRWLIRSEISGQVPFEVTYFTSGLSWRAFYMGTLSQDEKKMRLQGYVRVANSSGEDYDNAQTRLLVGKVNVLDRIADLAKRQYAYGRPAGRGWSDDYSSQWGMQVKNEADALDSSSLFSLDKKLADLKPKEIKKEGLSEYFLYTIEGTETIADKWGKRLPSFDVEDIEVESLYKYDEERWGKQAIRFVSFANDDEHNLGDTPIPDGTVKIYGKAGEQGYLSYVGGTNMKYIPVDEEVELNLGPARLVKVEPKLMDFKTENHVFDNRGNIAGWDEIRTWQMEIANTRILPIEIEITRGFGTAYWTLQTELPYEKHDATHARFETPLQPQSKQLLSYTLTTYHGRREEQSNQ
ncbi:MAG: DUF4139 domain-containing protein [Planctomycetota bacterium]|jgi:hypothetical protein